MAAVPKEQGGRQICELKKLVKTRTTGKVAAVLYSSGLLGRIASVLVPGVKAEPLAQLPRSLKAFFKGDTPSSLNDVTQAYGDLLRLSSTGPLSTRPLPVICIDEAHVLMEWDMGSAALEADLNALLRVLVEVRVPVYCCACLGCCCQTMCALLQVTKQSRQAHVILATAEYSFITCLTKSGYLAFTCHHLADALTVAYAHCTGAPAEVGRDFSSLRWSGISQRQRQACSLSRTWGQA